MRDGYTEELLAIERRRRRHRFGHRARITQLKWATGLFLVAACGCWLRLWWYPQPSEHVWIDDVLVEVVREGWLDSVAYAFFLGAVLCSVLLVALFLCGRDDRDTRADMERVLGNGRRSRAQRPAAPTASMPSLSVPRRTTTAASANAAAAAATAGAAWAPRHTGGSLFDAERPMRSTEELNRYLDSLAQHSVRPGTAEVAGLNGAATGEFMPTGSSASRTRQQSLYGPSTWANYGYGAASGSCGVGGGDLSPGTVRVLYEVGGADAVRAAGAGLDWASLSVMQPELCLGRMREWVSDVCRKLVEEVDQCDRWFYENDVAAFDCANPLNEVVPNTAAAPAASYPAPMGMGGFGAAAAPPAVPAGPVTKQTVLLREKEQVRSYPRAGDHFNTGLRYDQRLALEARLDVAATFAADQPPSNVELRQTRAYVLARLRTLAKQRTLVSFKNNGGPAQQWRPGLPCDAHLLLHVIRTSVDGLFPYVRFGYQGALSAREDLALFVGDTGAPYFYVRHFRGGRDRLYVTHPGQPTLFEALLVFAAIIHLYHADHYGGVRGTVDLEQAGLLRVLTGRSAPQASSYAGWGTRLTR